MDSGFFQSDILDYLEARETDYIIAAKFTHPIQRLIIDNKAWLRVDDGIEICELNYQSDSWSKSRRVIIVRQKIKDRPDAVGKTLSLFPEMEQYRNYRYSAYVTSLKLGKFRKVQDFSYR